VPNYLGAEVKKKRINWHNFQSEIYLRREKIISLLFSYLLLFYCWISSPDDISGGMQPYFGPGPNT